MSNGHKIRDPGAPRIPRGQRLAFQCLDAYLRHDFDRARSLIMNAQHAHVGDALMGLCMLIVDLGVIPREQLLEAARLGMTGQAPR